MSIQLVTWYIVLADLFEAAVLIDGIVRLGGIIMIFRYPDRVYFGNREKQGDNQCSHYWADF